MNNVIAFPDYAAIEETAAAWLIRIDQGELAPAQRQELRAWIEADQRHRLAFTRMAQLWGELDALTLLASLFPLATVEATPAADRPAMPPLRQRRAFRAGVAAACAMALTALPFLLGRTPAGAPALTEPAELVYQTGIGQQSQARLRDGSLITLNTHSKLRVLYTPTERSIYLVDGEAHFEVAKNPHVPFVVYAGNGKVRAVGTAFSVRIDAQQDVDVAVTEGSVEVVANSAAHAPAGPARAPQKITLKPGGTASYRDAIDAHAYVAPAQLEQKLAWKEGKWIFDGETLAEVIAEANRYSSRRIEVDPAIAGLRVGGYFNAGDIDALLATLEAGFNIRIRRSADAIQLSAIAAHTAAGP